MKRRHRGEKGRVHTYRPPRSQTWWVRYTINGVQHRRNTGHTDEALPVALCDGDSQGRAAAEALRKGLYAGDPKLVLTVDTYTGIPDSEVEDLIPAPLIASQLDRWQRAADVTFASEMESGKPIVPQIEAWAKKHGVALDVPGWKVELAKRVKRQMLEGGHSAIDSKVLDRWVRLFTAFRGGAAEDGARSKA